MNWKLAAGSLARKVDTEMKDTGTTREGFEGSKHAVKELFEEEIN